MNAEFYGVKAEKEPVEGGCSSTAAVAGSSAPSVSLGAPRKHVLQLSTYQVSRETVSFIRVAVTSDSTLLLFQS